MKPKILWWNAGENIDLDGLKDILSKLNVSMFEIDTQSSCYAIVIGPSPMTQEEANVAYEVWQKVFG